jgi:PAS domain S-box-containing protein
MQLRFFAGLILALLVAAAAFWAGPSSSKTGLATLSPEESAWLAAHKNAVRFVYDPKYPPFEFLGPDGEMRGMGRDLLGLVEKLLDVRFSFTPQANWETLLEMLRRREADAISFLADTPERRQYLSFTEPFVTMPVVVIIPAKGPDVESLEDLKGKKVAVVKGYVFQAALERAYGDVMEIVPVPDVHTGLRDVSFRVADAFVENLAVASYSIEQEGLTNLKVAADTGMSVPLCLGVRSDYPLLLSSLTKAFAAIPALEKDAIRRKWIGLMPEESARQKRIQAALTFVVAPLVILTAVLAVLSVTFKRTVHARTMDLERELERRARTERSLRESMELFEKLFNDSPDPALIIFGNHFVDCNKAAVTSLGYENKQSLLDTHPGVLSPEYQEDGELSMTKADKMMEIARNEGVNRFEWLHKRSDGTVFPVEVTLSPVPLGGRDVIYTLWRDITDRKLYEARMASLRTLLLDTLDAMPSVIAGVDETLKVTLWNRTAQAQAGLSPEEAMGMPLVEALPALATQEEIIRRAVERRSVEVISKMEVAGTASRQYLDVTIYPYSGAVSGGAVVRVDDVTARVLMENVMIQTEKMMSLGGLAAGMAHEINNPLGIIMQSAQVMRRRLDKDLGRNKEAAARLGLDLPALEAYLTQRGIFEYVGHIMDAGHRAAKIVQNMLQFSRKAETDWKACDVAGLIDRSLELASTDYDLRKQYDFKKIRIVKEYAAGEPSCHCMETEIEQVLLNLLRNAAQALAASPPGSKEPTITLRTSEDDGYIRIEVEDNGPGIPKDIQRRIFEPFFTTKPPGVGTGLGLSVSYFIVTKGHMGRMSAESEPGEGARFIILLPGIRPTEDSA